MDIRYNYRAGGYRVGYQIGYWIVDDFGNMVLSDTNQYDVYSGCFPFVA